MPPDLSKRGLCVAGGGVLAAAAVVRDTRVSLKGRACAAGCLKLYMARTPQKLVAAGTVPASALGTGLPATAPGAALQIPAGATQNSTATGASSQGTAQPALVPAAAAGLPAALGPSSAGLSVTSPPPAPQKKPKAPVGKGGSKKGTPAEPVSFALGWFADSGEDNGEERLWLEEQMLVADGVKEKVTNLFSAWQMLVCFMAVFHGSAVYLRSQNYKLQL